MAAKNAGKTKTTSAQIEALYEALPEGGWKGGKELRTQLGLSDDVFWDCVRRLHMEGRIATRRGHGGSFARVGADPLAFLAQLADDGTMRPNAHVRSGLKNWTHKRYWDTHGWLVQQGLIHVGKGQGGSVGKAVDHAAAKQAIVAAHRPPTPEPGSKEEDWYALLAHVLKHEWVPSQAFTDSLIEITARQGSKTTGGTWTRPDITIVTRSEYRLLPHPAFDVWTFEVKAPNDWSVLGVHEASAHGRPSTRPALLLASDTERDALEPWAKDRLEQCVAEAGRIGVGVLVAYPEHRLANWEWRVDPELHVPSPARLSEFLDVQLSAEAKTTIERWWSGEPH